MCHRLYSCRQCRWREAASRLQCLSSPVPNRLTGCRRSASFRSRSCRLFSQGETTHEMLPQAPLWSIGETAHSVQIQVQSIQKSMSYVRHLPRTLHSGSFLSGAAWRRPAVRFRFDFRRKLCPLFPGREKPKRRSQHRAKGCDFDWLIERVVRSLGIGAQDDAFRRGRYPSTVRARSLPLFRFCVSLPLARSSRPAGWRCLRPRCVVRGTSEKDCSRKRLRVSGNVRRLRHRKVISLPLGVLHPPHALSQELKVS
jgi:hypothetical protein